MASLFFSYSHKDESLRDQLETHLAGLKRQGLISAWHDRRITAGHEFGPAIDENLDAADVILLLVSPDFIASDYCCEQEMTRALERHKTGKARVIPVILRPCDWHDLPFGKLQAAPRDGKPITTWPNADQAFLDVVRAIKAALQEIGAGRTPRKPADSIRDDGMARPVIRSSNLRIKKQFSDLDKDRFLHDGFEFIARFFEGSLAELVSRNPGLAQTFRRIDANRCTAVVYQNGDKVCKGSLSLSGREWGSGESIEYAMTDTPNAGRMNEAVSVNADDQSLYFEATGMQSFGDRDEKLTPQGAAELFWGLFIRPLQGD